MRGRRGASPLPSGAMAQPRSAAARSASARGYRRARWVWWDRAKAGSAGSTSIWVRMVGQVLLRCGADCRAPAPAGSRSALRSRRRARPGGTPAPACSGRLERQQADLGAVSMSDDQLVLAREWGEGGRGDAHVLALVLDGHRLATSQGGRCRPGRPRHAWRRAPTGGGRDRPRILGMVPGGSPRERAGQRCSTG